MVGNSVQFPNVNAEFLCQRCVFISLTVAPLLAANEPKL